MGRKDHTCIYEFALFINAQPMPQENGFADEGARFTSALTARKWAAGFIKDGVKIALGNMSF